MANVLGGVTIQATEKNEGDEKSEASNKDEEITKLETVNPCLFTRNLVADTFYLILDGKVQIKAGKDNFSLEYSKFQHLGADSLLVDDYKPDFTARVKGKARLLVIKKQQYLEALGSMLQNVNSVGKHSL